MECSACNQPIEQGSKFCRHCGVAQQSVAMPDQEGLLSAPPKPNTSFPSGTIFTLLAIGAVGIAIFQDSGATREPNVKATGAEISDAPAEATQAAIEADAALAGNDGSSPSEGAASANWSYSSSEDKVRGGTTHYASTTSTNSIHQDFPYSSTTTMELTIRKSPAYGTDAILTVSSGQMMCPSYEGCSGTVRFDDGPAQRISFNGPADNSNETVFIVGAKNFIAKLKKSKRIVIEKTLYQAGNPQFEFDVSGLKWDH